MCFLSYFIGGNDLHIQNYMGGLGGEAPQPPEAENFENRNKTPPSIRNFLKAVGGGFYYAIEGI